MSQIVLAGGATGSAQFSVTAPSTNTNRSITLPDSSGQVSVLDLRAAQTASGANVDFQNIPATARRITVMFNGVSTNGTSNILVQIGAGSVTASGYAGSVNTANAGVNFVFSTGFMVLASTAAANLHYGQVIITNITGNTWVESSSLSAAVATSIGNQISAGSIALSGPLDRIRITTVNGTDQFDAGTINIMVE
jgi:hypothetical protein